MLRKSILLIFLSSLCLFPSIILAQTSINVALATAGATTQSSSSYNQLGVSFPSANAILGNRSNWCGVGQVNPSCSPGGGWATDQGTSVPGWIEVDLAATYVISQIVTVETQDMPTSPGTTPNAGTTCSVYCSQNFQVQTWNGTTWVTIPGGTITNNGLVLHTFNLNPTISTNKVRYYVTSTYGSDGLVRFVDLEVYYIHPNGAQTYNPISCNRNDVAAFSGIALDGDTILIPGGNCNWTSGITFAAGAGVTVMGNGTPTSGAATSVPDPSCENVSTGTTINMSGGIIGFKISPIYGSSLSRLSCMTLNATGSATGLYVSGACSSVASDCPNVRIDNILWTGWAGQSHPVNNSFGINSIQDVFGVIDHNDIDNHIHAGTVHFAEIGHANFLGVGAHGDNSWATPEYYGTKRFLFFENNTLRDAGCCENETNNSSAAGTGGARIVFRFNQILDPVDGLNVSLFWHENRGNLDREQPGRVFEFYQNNWSCNINGFGCPSSIAARGGTGLQWGNTFFIGPGSSMPTLIDLHTFRAYSKFATWLTCDGSGPYDNNDGTTYFTTTVQSWSSPVLTLAGNTCPGGAGSPGWTAHMWRQVGAPYSAHNVTQNSGTEILDNDASTLTLSIINSPAPSPSFTAGDCVTILKATSCEGSAAYGAGRLFSDDAMGNPTPVAASNQVSSPTYSWLNNFTGKTDCRGVTCQVVYTDGIRLIQGQNFYFENTNQATNSCSGSCTPFDGTNTIGIGHGPRTQRPASTTNGVAYWTTTGSNTTWNNGMADSGCLDIVQSGAWTNCADVPFIYPHPLDSTGNALTSAFTIQPVNTHSGSTMAMFRVEARSNGSVDTSFNGSVTVSVNTSPTCSASLGGTTTVTASNGVASFSAVTITGFSTSCTLNGTPSGYSASTSNAFSVGPNQIVFFIQPNASYNVGDILTTQVVSQFANGNIDFGSSSSVTLSVMGGCAISGTTTQNEVMGLTNFAVMVVSPAFSNCTLGITDGRLSAVSNVFNVSGSPIIPPNPTVQTGSGIPRHLRGRVK